MICFSVFFWWSYKKVKRNAVLLMGLSDSGKTVIYTRLFHHKFVRTHTSVIENSGKYDCGKVRTVLSYNFGFSVTCFMEV
jgi:signal recognition particle receptor subunit beta